MSGYGFIVAMDHFADVGKMIGSAKGFRPVGAWNNDRIPRPRAMPWAEGFGTVGAKILALPWAEGFGTVGAKIPALP